MENIQLSAAAARFTSDDGLEIEIQLMVRDPETGFANLVQNDILQFLRNYVNDDSQQPDEPEIVLVLL